MADRITASRWRRLGRLAWVSRRALPLAVDRFKGRVGSPQGEENSAHLQAAEEMLETLGNLKGLALKAGQMLSYMDGALPEDAEPVFRRVLQRLQQNVPERPWEEIEGVLREELGSLSTHFAEFEAAPFAAASIGQVHRAQLHDGTDVAVKVQYPGIREAVESDIDNLGLFRTLARPMMGVFGAKTNIEFAGNVIDEIRARLREELDYTHEAEMQVRFREFFPRPSGIVVPRVYLEQSTARVLTAEFVQGQSLEHVAEHAPQALKDRWAAVLTQAVTDQIYVHRLFHADPHPGNYLFQEDGRVALLDFGCVKEISAAMADDMRGYVSAAIRAAQTRRPQDRQAYEHAAAHAMRLEEADADVARFYYDLLFYVLRPLLRDEPFTFTREFTAGVNDLAFEMKRALLTGGKRRLRIPKIPPVPGDYTFINRLQWGFFSILTRLGATVNWHRMLPAELRESSRSSRG